MASDETELDLERLENRAIDVDYVETGCFVCGDRAGHFRDTLYGFVKSKEAGARIVEMFGGLASVSTRTLEPTYIKIKISCCNNHWARLIKLQALLAASQGVVMPALIEESKKVPII